MRNYTGLSIKGFARNVTNLDEDCFFKYWISKNAPGDVNLACCRPQMDNVMLNPTVNF